MMTTRLVQILLCILDRAGDRFDQLDVQRCGYRGDSAKES
jgi:hypothetical protein